MPISQKRIPGVRVQAYDRGTGQSATVTLYGTTPARVIALLLRLVRKQGIKHRQPIGP